MRLEIISLICYFSIVIAIGIFSHRRRMNASDFIMGNRSMNSWLTALAAHASDMSNWLFMGYPALIFTQGLMGAWVAIGLTFCMLLNWKLIAPKIRTATEETGSLTLSSFFEKRFSDDSGTLRLATAFICFFFYTIYISAGLVGMGLLTENLFGIDYRAGIACGFLIVIPYVFIGGFLTLARIDLFQGIFLLAMILLVPLFQLGKIGGISSIAAIAPASHFTLWPDHSGANLLKIICMCFGWGLGYFGQPAIVTKFMGIRKVSDIKNSQRIGMSWMVLSMGAATLVGFVAIPLFQGNIANPEMIFVEMVKGSFSPFLIGFILCAVLAASLNVMSSQLLAVSSIFTEDLYKRRFRTSGLWAPRLCILVIALFAFIVAYFKISSIYDLVYYAWSGLGASFGPLLLFALYSKSANRYGAWAGVFIGSLTVVLWPSLNKLLPVSIDAMLPGFAFSSAAIWLVSYATRSSKKLVDKTIF